MGVIYCCTRVIYCDPLSETIIFDSDHCAIELKDTSVTKSMWEGNDPDEVEWDIVRGIKGITDTNYLEYIDSDHSRNAGKWKMEKKII